MSMSRNRINVVLCQEAMRLLPVVPMGTLRLAPAGGLRLGGYDVPEGAMLWVFFSAMFRSPHVWEAPNEFKPARATSLPPVSTWHLVVASTTTTLYPTPPALPAPARANAPTRRERARAVAAGPPARQATPAAPGAAVPDVRLRPLLMHARLTGRVG